MAAPKNWLELQEKLFEGAWQPGLKRFRSPFAYRGLERVNQHLETSLFRLGPNSEALERHLLRNFIKYASRDVVERDTLWHWLSVAQHHGLPTRLLDWSFSPYVALHFATANTENFNEDGIIWAANFHEIHKLLPTDLRDALKTEGSDVFTVEMLNKNIKDLSELKSLANNPCVIFFEPPSIDDRIVNQSALFSFLSDPNLTFEQWIAGYPNSYYKIVIPAALKWEIRDKLDQANITERVLFPGLDGLTKWLKRHYSPGP